jgi:hypothetical protein
VCRSREEKAALTLEKDHREGACCKWGNTGYLNLSCGSGPMERRVPAYDGTICLQDDEDLGGEGSKADSRPGIDASPTESKGIQILGATLVLPPMPVSSGQNARRKNLRLKEDSLT